MLMRCFDENYYVVKFQNNPQGVRVLANDLLGTLLARLIGLPVPEPAVVWVDEVMIHYSPEMRICFDDAKPERCLPGLCFGSRIPSADQRLKMIWDLLPSTTPILNVHDFLGMLVFDKWTGNTDHRGVIFVREDIPADDSPYYGYEALMIDQGMCFNGPKWDFPDSPNKGPYYGLRERPDLYMAATSIEAFEPWLERLECEVTPTALNKIAADIPPEWYEEDSVGLRRLLEQLYERRTKVKDLLIRACQATPRVFVTWRHVNSALCA